MHYSHLDQLLRLVHRLAVAQDSPADKRMAAIACHPFLLDFIEDEKSLVPNSEAIVQKLLDILATSAHFGDRWRIMTPPERHKLRERFLQAVKDNA